MTAPNYPDKHEINTLTLNQIRNMVTSEPYDQITVLAIAAISLWGARDSARETAAMQDAAIHRMAPRVRELEQVWKAIQVFQERGYESGFKEINETITRMIRFEAKSKIDLSSCREKKA